MSFFTNGNVFWSHKGTLRNVNLLQFVGLTLKNKWTVGVTGNYHTELFEKRFKNHAITPEIGYNLEQWNSYSLLYQRGRNFDSDFFLWTFRSNFKPNDRLSLEYRIRRMTLTPDPDDISTFLNVLTGDYNFTTDLYFRLFMQVNSRNNLFYLYGLLGWRFALPFGALYIAYTADRFDDPLELTSKENQRTLFVKLTVPISL